MSGARVDLLLWSGIDPATRNAPAGEDQRMVLVFVYYGELKIVVERRARYGLPHRAFIEPRTAQQFDLNHRSEGTFADCTG